MSKKIGEKLQKNLDDLLDIYTEATIEGQASAISGVLLYLKNILELSTAEEHKLITRIVKTITHGIEHDPLLVKRVNEIVGDFLGEEINSSETKEERELYDTPVEEDRDKLN